jgi:hypothetical protein
MQQYTELVCRWSYIILEGQSAPNCLLLADVNMTTLKLLLLLLLLLLVVVVVVLVVFFVEELILFTLKL